MVGVMIRLILLPYSHKSVSIVKGVKEVEDVKKTLLLAMSPMEDKTCQDADMHKLFIISTLASNGKKLDNVCALIGDN
jgi:hypothetical protein